MNTNFKSTSKSCLQNYILPSLTGRGWGRVLWGRVCFFLLSLLLFAACSSDNDEQVQQPQPEKSYPLTIEVTENPMTGDGENSSNRAAITDNSSLASFKMYYTYGTSDHSGTSFTATKDEAGKWSSTDAAWPIIDTEIPLTWYTYTSGTFNYNSGNPYINFTIEEWAKDQKDLLVAKTTDTWANCSGNLSFAFDHACSAFRFLVKKAKNLDDYTVNVTEIKLWNIKNNGLYNFGTSEWSNQSGAASYTLCKYNSETPWTLGSSSYTELEQGVDGPYFFVIPQDLTAWNGSGSPANTYISITCKITKTSDSSVKFDGTAYIPFGGITLNKGKKRDLKINIGTSSLRNSSGNLIFTPSI